MAAELQHTVIRSATREVTIGADQPFCIIGERINPTGRPKFQEQLRAGDLSLVEADVHAQVAGGANHARRQHGRPAHRRGRAAGQGGQAGAEPDRPAAVHRLLRRGGAGRRPRGVRRQGTGQLGDRREGAARRDPARWSSGTARPSSPSPTRRRRSPRTRTKRLEITRKIIDIACGTYEIPLEDIVIDPLAMPVGADSTYAKKTMEAIALIRDEFGVNMTLGAGNVSFGMPGRHALGVVVPADGDDVRPDLARSWTLGRRRWSRRSAPPTYARQRRVGRGVDQRAPGQAGGRDRVSRTASTATSTVARA